MFYLLLTYAIVLGAIVGSFLNVVIHRYPLGESIVFPGSHCPGCSAAIKAWDNIPLISYLLLRGRCRACHTSISARYPLVEAANASLYGAAFVFTAHEPMLFFPLAAILSMTIVLIYIDLDIQILPDAIDLPGILLGMVLGFLGAGQLTDLTLASSLLDSVCGAALGGGIILMIAWSYKVFRGIEGMGQGDVKMMAMIGATTGWRTVLPVLFLASLVGAAVGITLALRTNRNLQFALPFGVFLGLAFILAIFFGGTMLTFYDSLLLR